MDIHVAPVFPDSPPHPQCAWLRDGIQNGRAPGFGLADRPDVADLILLADAGAAASHARFKWRTSRFLTHPLVRTYRARCFLYHEQDVPRLYLPGLYSYLEWFPGVDRFAAAVAPAEHLQNTPNAHLVDDPPPEERDLLYSFVGRNCHPVRDRLLRLGEGRADIVLVDTKDVYDHYADASRQTGSGDFVTIMRRSRWAICPRGWSAGSRRLFEAMRLGIAPVILADSWIPLDGPDWERCSLWIREEELPDLTSILEARSGSWYPMGLAAQQAYAEYFADDVVLGHGLRQLARLHERRRGESTARVATRQWIEFLVHLIGWTSPVLTRARARGLTAIADRRPPGSGPDGQRVAASSAGL